MRKAFSIKEGDMLDITSFSPRKKRPVPFAELLLISRSSEEE
jgi:hypothetical protein